MRPGGQHLGEHNQPIGSMGGTVGSLKSTALGLSSTLFSGACHPFRGRVGVSIEDEFFYVNQDALLGVGGQWLLVRLSLS